jgi:energy-coupling factor transport system ATP-binding protein
VDAGEIVSVLGPPGSGKTGLALELAFLRLPTDGTTLFRGENPMDRRSRLQPLPRPREVTMLVQNAEDQLFAKTVYEDVAFGPRHLGLDEDAIEVRVLEALEAVRLDPLEVRSRSPFALSGGERRRVALAGVLAMHPEVLILDEPTANLDPRTRTEFLDLLAPLRGQSAIVWLTSSAREASLADRVYLLRDGATRELGPGATVLESWKPLARAGIELPPVYELAKALEDRGENFPDGVSADALVKDIVSAWHEQHDR